MRLLVVGGTVFLGGAVARAGVASGHDVTVMTRSGLNVATGAKTLIANREQPNDLRGRFDVVIDTCGYAPDMVTHLAGSVGDVHFVFVSSISVYEDLSEPLMAESGSAPAATPVQLQLASEVPSELRGTSEPYGAAYGPLKRSCEETALAAFGDSASLIRLGLIVGPGDYTDRFTWWVRRCDAGGVLPVPAPRERHVQIIDVRDAAVFLLHLAEQRLGGVFHVTRQPIAFADLLAEIATETSVPLDPEYLPLSDFTDAGLEPWADLPLILPDDTSVAHMQNVSVSRATAAGLTFRPSKDTIRDTLM